jgi:hypothetical protein
MSRKLQRQILVFQPYSLHQRFHGALRLSQLDPQTSADPFPWANWLQQPRDQAAPPLTGNVNHDAIALLPLWLFTHESWRQRLATIQQIPNWDTTPPHQQASMWLYGEAIAQVIRPQAKLNRLLTTLPDRWQRQTHHGAPPLGPIWENLLPQLQQWQQQHTPLNQITPNPDQAEAAIAISLFSLVTSGPHWSIAQTRAQRLLPDTPISRNLLGGLWGAAYGWTILPIEHLPIALPKNAELPWQSLSQNLLQVWSGQLPQTRNDLPTPIVFGPR